jgi:hypothetical protein
MTDNDAIVAKWPALDQDVIDNLSPGIRQLVIWANVNRFRTIDSGDGGNHAAGMGCAPPVPMVAIQTSPEILTYEADRLQLLLERRGVKFGPPAGLDPCSSGDVPDITWPSIQASYDPADKTAIIVVVNVTSASAGLDGTPGPT